MLQATNREKALALAVKLTEEMPDMDYEITSELQFVIQHNKWLGIEIKMPKTPFKGDSDAASGMLSVHESCPVCTPD